MPIIRHMKSRQKKGGRSYDVTVTVGNDSAESVETVTVKIPEVEGQPVANPLLVTLTFDSNDGEDRVFSNDSLTFSSDAVDSVYNMTGTMKGAKGKQIGDPLTTEVVVEAAEVEVET